MKTTTQKQTASQAYKARLTQLQKQIKRIEDALKTHTNDGLNWGHVGDLGYLIDELKTAADFITGEGE